MQMERMREREYTRVTTLPRDPLLDAVKSTFHFGLGQCV